MQSAPRGTCAWWCAGAWVWAWGVATANVLSVMATKSQGNDANTETKTTAKYLPIFFYFGCLVVYEDIVVSGSFTCIPIVTSTHTYIHTHTYIYTGAAAALPFPAALAWCCSCRGFISSLFPACQGAKSSPLPLSYCILIPFKQ